MKIDKIVILSTSIIKNEKGEVLLLQRSGKGSYEDYWQFPEGKIENQETPQDAIVREVKEELGLEIVDIKNGPVFSFTVDAKGNRYLGVRITLNITIASEKISLSDEHKDYKWFDKKDTESINLLGGVKEVLDYVL